MSEQEAAQRIPGDSRVAVGLRSAIRAGDVAAIQDLLRENPALAAARLVGNGTHPGRAMRHRCTMRPAATTSTWPRP